VGGEVEAAILKKKRDKRQLAGLKRGDVVPFGRILPDGKSLRKMPNPLRKQLS